MKIVIQFIGWMKYQILTIKILGLVAYLLCGQSKMGLFGITKHSINLKIKKKFENEGKKSENFQNERKLRKEYWKWR